MQLNLNRSSAVHDLVMESEPKADVLIASEPNKKRMDKGGWYVDTYRDAAIKVLNRKLKVENSGRGKGYVWVEIDGVIIVSGYASPNIGIEEFKKYLGRLENCIRHARLDVLVAGDLNAKSPIWGSGAEDNRGAALADLLSANNMFAQNLGEKATFVGARGQSVIDITCATSGLAPRIQNWKVEDTETLSDHRLITYEIVGQARKKEKT
jgi:endonuclease/exonuclease/phosphatase family metal-dependent hydrolase